VAPPAAAREPAAPAARPSDEQGTDCCSADLAAGALELLQGRWKMVILFRLFAVTSMRFSELQRSIPEVSQKMLSQQLRELERAGIVARTVHAQVPPRVDYQLTELGQALRAPLRAFRDWARLRRASLPAG
jgi:DNA-binding HxlR family transcriptional regulator